MQSFKSKLALNLLTALALSACASSSPTPESTMRLYSPSLLRLKAGQPVTTQDGQYIPQVDEVWHSHADYMQRVYEGLTH